MQRKTLILVTQIFAISLLFISFCGLLAVSLFSDDGDPLDRNAGWIVAVFVASIGLFIYSHYIPDGFHYKKKTTEELLNEIKKSNLRKIKVGL